nr:hypothetical protein [Rhodococcus sp. (in: high G+C Gram-positive bacteria)]
MTFFPPDSSSSRDFSQPNDPTWPASNPPRGSDPFGMSSQPMGDPFAGGVQQPAYGGAQPASRSNLDGPPTSIWVAVGCLIAAALVHVFSAIMLIMWVYELKGQATTAADGLLERDVSGVSSAQIGGWADNAADSVSMFLAGVFIVTAAVYVVIAFGVKAGRNGARVTATVFACLSVFGLLTGPTGWLIVALGVIGVVCMWLKPSSAYFDYRKMNRSGVPRY